MKQYTVTEYEPEDYEKLEHMSIDDIVECLEHVEHGYLPTRSYKKDGTEEDYDNEKIHLAMRQAISRLERPKKPDKDTVDIEK